MDIGFKMGITNLDKIILRKTYVAENYTKRMLFAQKKSTRAIYDELIAACSNYVYTQRKKPPFPYSFTNPSWTLDPKYVNVQQDNLRQGWRIRTIETNGRITSSIYNVMRYGIYFDGWPTVHMVARKLLQYVFSETRVAQLEILHEEHVAAMQKLVED